MYPKKKSTTAAGGTRNRSSIYNTGPGMYDIADMTSKDERFNIPGRSKGLNKQAL